MSVFPFIRNLIGVKEDNAFQIALDAIVKWDPEGSSAAQLLTMEQNLDLIGRRVESARDAYDRERKELDTIVASSACPPPISCRGRWMPKATRIERRPSRRASKSWCRCS